jgi:hypothetical protein
MMCVAMLVHLLTMLTPSPLLLGDYSRHLGRVRLRDVAASAAAPVTLTHACFLTAAPLSLFPRAARVQRHSGDARLCSCVVAADCCHMALLTLRCHSLLLFLSQPECRGIMLMHSFA